MASAARLPMLGQMTAARAGEHHLDFKPLDTSEAVDALRAAETVYQLALEQNPQEVELSQKLLIYPEDEGDAVTITERDMEGLQPMGYLSNNIVDFYIRYLERRLSQENRKRMYFFNSFFFTKLLQSTASVGIDPRKADYEQLRKWTGEVNLFERDYVFVPILRSSHWSLVIICHLSSVTSSPGDTQRSPCMLHLDPIEGKHESFEGQVRSYILQAWMDRFQAPSHMDQLLALCQMKYVGAKATLKSVCSTGEVGVCNDMLLRWLSALNEELRWTLLDLVQELEWACFKKFNLEVVCRRLAIVQDCKPQEICECVLKLRDLNLVDVMKMDPKEAEGDIYLYFQKTKEWSLDVKMGKIIREEVLDKYPYLKTYHRGFPIEQSLFQRIRALWLCHCKELEHLDLKSFPELCFLQIQQCEKLKLVTGWEYATSLSTMGDLSGLCDLIELSLEECNNLSSIEDLSGLYALTKLSLFGCMTIKRVPGLGCLKALIYLDLSYTCIEEISSIEELHLLNELLLSGCVSLRRLPFLGHLKALTYLDLSGSGVKEIPGIEHLVNLESLYCEEVELKWLPYLEDLSKLKVYT